MQLETFQGHTMAEVMSHVRLALGDEAMIISTRIDETEDGQLVEIVAANADDVDAFRRQLDGGAVPTRTAADRIGPLTIALVGPPGSGKTATAIKMALHPRALGDRRVGLITLDTYRVGAMDEISTYADVAGLELEVVYNARDLANAMRRLSHCDAVIIDTPGRVEGATDGEWVELLNSLQVDEVHLVLPAGLRSDVAKNVADSFEAVSPSHLLLSKADQLPGTIGLASIPQKLGLPIRWLTNGQDMPGALAVAGPRIMGALSGDEAGSETAWTRMVG